MIDLIRYAEDRRLPGGRCLKVLEEYLQVLQIIEEFERIWYGDVGVLGRPSMRSIVQKMYNQQILGLSMQSHDVKLEVSTKTESVRLGIRLDTAILVLGTDLRGPQKLGKMELLKIEAPYDRAIQALNIVRTYIESHGLGDLKEDNEVRDF